jgi:hypothetical protein
MKKTEINPKVIEILHDFEQLEAIDAPETWNQALMQKLAESEATHSSGFAHPISYATVLVLFMLMNAVCIVKIFNTQQPSYNRIAKLNLISKELLIPNVTLRE